MTFLKVRIISFLLLIAVLVPSVVAQTTSPTVTTNLRFVRLTHGERADQPFGGFVIREVSEPVTATFDPGSILQSTGGQIIQYKWAGLDFGTSDTNSATVTGVEHGPGVYTVSLNIVVKYPNGSTNTLGPWGSKVFYVVGGPLTLSVYNGVSGTPVRDSTATSPMYLEYFGFDPSGTKPAGAQNPQWGHVTAFMGQPAGTTYSWSVPSPLKMLSTGNTSTLRTIDIGPNDGSGGSPSRVMLTYLFSNNSTTDPVNGYSVADDSDMQVDASGAMVPTSAYTFTSHKPAELDPRLPATTGPLNIHSPATGFSDWGCQMIYHYQLFDDASMEMGHVYVAERWETVFNNVASQLWKTPSGDPLPTGAIDDTFQLYGPTAFPQSGGTPMAGPLNHRYYAGTTDTSLYNPSLSGVLVLRTVTTYWTDFIKNQ